MTISPYDSLTAGADEKDQTASTNPMTPTDSMASTDSMPQADPPTSAVSVASPNSVASEDSAVSASSSAQSEKHDVLTEQACQSAIQESEHTLIDKRLSQEYTIRDNPVQDYPIQSSTVLRHPIHEQQPTSTTDSVSLSYVDVAVPSPAHTKTTPLSPPPQYSKRIIKNLWGEHEYLLPFEESLLVPDTMPDMSRVLFAEGHPELTQPDKTSYKRGDLLAADMTVFTVYVPSTDEAIPIDVVRSTVSLKTDKCWDKCTGDNLRVSTSVRELSVEMINERKFVIKGRLLLKITDICTKELMVFQNVANADIITRKGSICITGLDFDGEETTEISQDIDLREDQPSPVRILNESLRIVENHRQITSAKLVINATIHSHVLYLGDMDGEKRLSRVINKTDFTQFVPVNENTDPSMIRLSFYPDNLHIAIENKDKLHLQGQVITHIQSFSNQDIDTTDDAYHKERDITFDTSRQQISTITGTVSGEISAREVMEPDEKDITPQQLLWGSCHMTSITASPDRDRLIIEGSLPVEILALDEDGRPFLMKNAVTLRGSLEKPAASGQSELFIVARLKDFWFDDINSRQIEVNISLHITVWTKESESFKSITQLSFIENGQAARRIPMALYVAGSNDTLWDVAKKYKTDAEELAALNQLDPSKPLTVGTKLLIVR